MGMKYRYTRVPFDTLKGKFLAAVEVDGDNDLLVFRTATGEVYEMCHRQDCCETVYIESIVGDLKDLIGHAILLAEESSSSDEHPEGVAPPDADESFTWTFYKLATIKGYVDIRWFGTSNGYYSEEVSLYLKEEVEDSDFEVWWESFKRGPMRQSDSGYTDKEIARAAWKAGREKCK